MEKVLHLYDFNKNLQAKNIKHACIFNGRIMPWWLCFEKLNLIRASISSLGMESESGLRNVQKRIKLYYGNEYGIKIDSMKGSGTSIWVTIPAIEENDD